MEAQTETEVLVGKLDIYNGITILEDALPKDKDTFERRLDESLRVWRAEGRRGIWIKIPIQRSELIPIAVNKGFVFHHAEKTHLMLNQWLPQNEENKLPNYATHTVGVGGFVLNDKNELLVVSERYGESEIRWKLPGGMADIGERIGEAAVREVLEETGVRTQFISIPCFRQLHPLQFDRSDLYFVCRLKPLSSEITMDEGEIAACRWLPVEEFINDPKVRALNRELAKFIMENSKNGKDNFEFSPMSGVTAAPGRNVTFYDFYVNSTNSTATLSHNS